MRTHVTILAWLYIISSAFFLLMGLLGFLAFLGMGAFAGLTGALPALPFLGGLGAFVFFIFLIFFLPGLLAGIGMLSYAPWARILGIILSVLNLFNWPIGTLIGIYGLYVLFNPETSRLFEGRSY